MWPLINTCPQSLGRHLCEETPSSLLCFSEWSSLAGAAISIHCFPACCPVKSVWRISRSIFPEQVGRALPLPIVLAVRHRAPGRAFWVLLEFAKTQQGARFETCECLWLCKPRIQ